MAVRRSSRALRLAAIFTTRHNGRVMCPRRWATSGKVPRRTISCRLVVLFSSGKQEPAARLGLAIKRLEDRLHEAEVVDQQPLGPHEKVPVFGDVEVVDRLSLVRLDRFDLHRRRRPSAIDRRL